MMAIFKNKNQRSKNNLEVDDGTFLLNDSSADITMAIGDDDKELPITPRYTPTSFEDIKQAAKGLMDYKKIIIVLTKMPKDDRSKTLNFMSGVIFAKEGYLTKIEDNVFELEIK
ncbi:cell division protein SepF [Mesoplasma lactucae]|uniref:Uncharacterized protein n=1 Tax=Mesoplasma lactucae ATCC 49193 TaxID=81460 RepID=A0A291IRV8_9MOLU|nr:cell division protein SepF [Mesoplasma lactucae]ATG97484.1 hypothetical protein CP520_01800 [Mesoplasma lactucae ATCC 49193]ATZ20061.1 cell division inhibitor SepF [Mesoplasma lactucae ATCC 49193]MCL8216809.1 Cell division protein SepF [Mesoplasma lactucae ATCC 49193]